jgi:Ca-activated chloride channel family protein
MHWVWPWQATALGVALAALAVGVARRAARRRQPAMPGQGPGAGAVVRLPYSPRRRAARLGLLAVALALVVAALARPQGGAVLAGVEVRTTVMLVLDLSASMRATDVLPSRLEVARQWLEALTAQLPVARLGLIGFAGEAQVLCPATEDHALLLELLRSLPVELALREGSELGAALALGRKVLERCGGGSLVLVTDGEHHDPEPVAALAGAGAVALAVVTVGGSTPVPVPAGPGAGAAVLDPRDGRQALTAARAQAMAALARAANGLAVEAEHPGEGLAEVARRIGERSAGVAYAGGAPGRSELAPWFLALAIVLLLVRLLLPARPPPRAAGPGGADLTALGLVLAFAALCGMAPGPGVESSAGDPRRELELEELREAGRRAPGHDRHRCLYNLALALHRLGETAEARRTYLEALGLPGCPRSVRAHCLNNLGAIDLGTARTAAARDPAAALAEVTQALASLREANRLDPELEAAVLNLREAGALADAVQGQCEAADVARRYSTSPPGPRQAPAPTGHDLPAAAAAVAAGRASTARDEPATASDGTARVGERLLELSRDAGSSRDFLRLLHGGEGVALPAMRLPW